MLCYPKASLPSKALLEFHQITDIFQNLPLRVSVASVASLMPSQTHQVCVIVQFEHHKGAV